MYALLYLKFIVALTHPYSQIHQHFKWCQKFISDVLMMGRRVRLYPKVGIIHGPGPPEESELLLVHPLVTQPVKSHIHGFGMFWLTPAVYDALCQ